MQTFVLCTLLPFAHLTAQDQDFIDLTDPVLKEQEEKRAERNRLGCGSSRGSSAPIPELTLRLEIDNLNDTVYAAGDEVICDLRSSNVGETPLLVPWDSRREIVYGDCVNTLGKKFSGLSLEAALSLEFKDREGTTQVVALHGLYATLDDPLTYRVLKPHESVLVRTRGALYFIAAGRNSKSDHKPQLPQQFEITASYSADNAALPNAYKPIYSVNQREVIVEEQKPSVRPAP